MRGLLAWGVVLTYLTCGVVACGTAAVYSTAQPRPTPYAPPPPPIPHPTQHFPVKSGVLPSSEVYEVTAYSWHCIMPRRGPEPRHRTRAADGSWPRADETVAADWALHPPGSEVLIEGLGYRRVTDKGYAIHGRRLDIFLASCAEARSWGRQSRQVWKVPPPSTTWSRE